MKRFLYTASVESVAGWQTFYIDAETREEADERAREHDTNGIYQEELSVEDIGRLVFDNETETDDFGDFPPTAATPTPLADAAAIAEREAKPDMKEGRWCPDECPITAQPFFMWLEHPELGYVPTYGGPFDSYTIAAPDDDGYFRVERYDHDLGEWIEGGAPVHLRDELTETVEIEPEADRAALATTEATDAIAPTEGAESGYVEFFGDTARDRIIEKMARAMNVATDGHDRYWSGYVKSAKSAHKVVADYLASTAPSPKPAVDALTTGAVEEPPMTFGEWFSENCPEYQRQSYSAADMESNVRGMAYEAWNFSHPASEPKAEAIHYPECWDTAAYPTVESALSEVYAAFKCTNHIGASEPKALTDGRILDLALDHQCDPEFDHYVFKDTELVEFVHSVLADRGSEGGKS